MEDWGNFLHRILQEDSEDSALIKVFLLVWGFGGKQRRLTAATGGGEGGIKVWVTFWRR